MGEGALGDRRLYSANSTVTAIGAWHRLMGTMCADRFRSTKSSSVPVIGVAGVSDPLDREVTRVDDRGLVRIPAGSFAMSDPFDAFTDLLDRFTAAVESGDEAAFAALFCEDGVYDDVFYGEFRGRERLAEMLREHFHGNARDFRWEMRDPVCDGRVGYAGYTFSYTSTMKRSEGRRVVFTGCSRFRLREGLIESYREWAFGTAGLAQLGAPPAVLARQSEREAGRIRAAADRTLHRLDGST